MAAYISIPLNRGSNLSLPCTIYDAAGAAVDITGWTFSVVAVIPAALADNVSATVTSGSSGQFSLSLPWSAEWPDGEGNLVSIRLKPSGLNEALPELQVVLQ